MGTQIIANYVWSKTLYISTLHKCMHYKLDFHDILV